MIPDNFTAYLVLTTLVSLMPGPAVLFSMSQAAWRGPQAGFAAALGIETGNTIYYALSALGLASLIAASGTAFTVIKWLGAGYLAWLGITAIIQSFRKTIAAPTGRGRASLSGYRDGLFVAMGNPKGILYFVALLPQFIDPAKPVIGQTFVLGGAGIGIDLVAQSLYVLAGGLLAKALSRPRVRRWFERGLGGVFIGLSAMTALIRRAA